MGICKILNVLKKVLMKMQVSFCIMLALEDKMKLACNGFKMNRDLICTQICQNISHLLTSIFNPSDFRPIEPNVAHCLRTVAQCWVPFFSCDGCLPWITRREGLSNSWYNWTRWFTSYKPSMFLSPFQNFGILWTNFFITVVGSKTPGHVDWAFSIYTLLIEISSM